MAKRPDHPSPGPYRLTFCRCPKCRPTEEPGAFWVRDPRKPVDDYLTWHPVCLKELLRLIDHWPQLMELQRIDRQVTRADIRATKEAAGVEAG